MAQPQISIVISLYNKQDQIERCLHSVLAQTFGDFEVVIVDDGSTDASAARAAAFADPRIRLIRQPNRGVAAARNLGAAEARAHKIAFLDADDTWLPAHLAQILRLFQNVPGAGLVLTAYWIDRGRGLRRRVRMPRRHMNRDGLVRDFFALPEGKDLPSASAVSRQAFTAAGGFRQMFGEDVDLFLRLAALAPVAYGREATAVWHVDAQNRRCVKQQASSALHEPGSLQASLDFLAASPLATAAARQKARRYVAARERRAIVRTLLAGRRAHAHALLLRWQQEFGGRDPMLQFLVRRAPLGLLRLWTRMRAMAGKAATAAAYASQWSASRRAFGAPARAVQAAR